MIISIGTQKAFEKIQHPFMIKIFNKLCIEETYLNIIKPIYFKFFFNLYFIYFKSTTNIILNVERLNKTRVPIPFLFNIVLEVLDRAIKQGKDIKGIRTLKKEVKLFLFTDDMILYTENLRDSSKKLRYNEFSKFAGYKINIQKSVVFLHTNNKFFEKERNPGRLGGSDA